MTLPKSVIEAGRRERGRYGINPEPTDVPWVEQSQPASVEVDYEEVFGGTYVECQDFVEARVFRAMLRALADEYWPDSTIPIGLRAALNAIAEDGDG